MELVVESDDGRILGSRNLKGSRWERVGDHFENLQVISVAIAVGGIFGSLYIENDNKRICGEQKPLGYLKPGSEVLMAPHKLKLSRQLEVFLWN